MSSPITDHAATRSRRITIAVIISAFVVLGIASNILNPPAPKPAPLTFAHKIEQFTWRYERPAFFATVIIRNTGTAPFQRASITVRFTDKYKGTIVGRVSDNRTIARVIQPNDTAHYTLRADAPDLPTYLVRNLISLADIHGEIDTRVYER